MNTKPSRIRVGVGGLALALAAAGCSGAENSQGESEIQGATPVEAAAPDPLAETRSAMIVHATVSLGKDHDVEFVEFQPGMFGLVERGYTMTAVPKVTPELAELPWEDQYRHFAGRSAPLPDTMVKALSRAALAPAQSLAEPTTEPPAMAPSEVTGDGPHFYTAGEQASFVQTFCNGVDLCAQGFDATNMQTPHKVNRWSAVGFIGSEATQSGTLQSFYWKCAGVWPFPTICKWIFIQSFAIAPGQFVNPVMSKQSSSWFFLWQLRSGGSGTLVSSAADF